jgi:hypothetical protein
VSRLIAVLDANVLYGITPTDLLVTLAVRDAYRPHWSAAIFDEAIRNITTLHLAWRTVSVTRVVHGVITVRIATARDRQIDLDVAGSVAVELATSCNRSVAQPHRVEPAHPVDDAPQWHAIG